MVLVVAQTPHYTPKARIANHGTSFECVKKATCHQTDHNYPVYSLQNCDKSSTDRHFDKNIGATDRAFLRSSSVLVAVPRAPCTGRAPPQPSSSPPQKKHLVVPDPDAADSCLQKKTPWCTIGLLDALTRRPTTAYDSRANGVHESADKHVMRWDRCGALNALGCLGRWWAVMGSNHRPTG